MSNEYEFINHQEINNLKVFLVNLEYREPHIHSDIELFFVLDGEVTIFSQNMTLHLKNNDFVIINSCRLHELKANDHALILAFQISPKFCKEYYPQISDIEFMFCKGTQSMPAAAQEICFALSIKLAHHYYSKSDKFQFRCIGLLNILFYHFVKNMPYQKITKEEQNSILLKKQRIQKIVSFMEGHYCDKLLLADIARQEHLSITYLSHFFRDNLGTTFQEYLSSLRCEKARQLLLLTNHNMLNICLESGFSDIRYLNKAFVEKYNCTPKHYRNHYSKADLPSGQKSMPSMQKFLSGQAGLVVLEQYYDRADTIFSNACFNDVL